MALSKPTIVAIGTLYPVVGSNWNSCYDSIVTMMSGVDPLPGFSHSQTACLEAEVCCYVF